MGETGEIEFLRRLARAAASTLDAADLLALVASQSAEALGTSTCSVYLLDEDQQALTLSATHGLSATGVGHAKLPLGRGVTGWAAERREAVVVADVRAEERFEWMAGVDQARFVSMCSVPIVSGNRLVGALNVQTDAPRDFAPGDVELLTAIAAQVAGIIERSSLQQRLEARLADLRRSQEIHHRFTQLAVSGAPLGTICHAIAVHAGVAVAVYDDTGAVLETSDASVLPACLTGFVDPASRADNLTVAPVRAGEDLMGWLAASAGHEVGAEIRRAALEHGVTVLALELSRQRAAAEAEQRLRGDVVDELLAGGLGSVEIDRLLRRAALLGSRIEGEFWVLMLQARGPGALWPAALASRLLRASSDLTQHRYPGSLIARRGEAIVAMLPGTADLEEVERFAGDLVQVVAALWAGGLTCGVSGSAGSALELSRIGRQARSAVAIASRQRDAAPVASYARLGVERLLLDVESNGNLAGFVEEWIGPLLRLEGRSRAAAPLTQTLEALAGEGWNLRAAARRLNVHVNTLLYRLQRISEVTGRSLDDADVRLAMTLALRAHRIAPPLDEVSRKKPAKPRSERPFPVGPVGPTV